MGSMLYLMNLITLTSVLLCINHFLVRGGSILTEEEDLEMEKSLRMLNKPAQKTITTKDGGKIDCIEIYKQPSLDHHLLKDHKIRMRPTFLPKNSMRRISQLSESKFTMSRPMSVSCPQGTVPIPRTRREDLIRAKKFSQSFITNIHPLTGISPGKHLAIIRSVPDPKTTYKGIQANFNTQNPTIHANQSSFAQFWIENGSPSVRNSLQFGWMVAPDLYGDNRTHGFIYWSAVHGTNMEGCFNYLCKGFVQTSKSWGVGGFLEVSPYGSNTQAEIVHTIFQDRVTGDWWLRNPHINENIGYWPKALLPELAKGASQVVWGGHTLAKPNRASPPMGNGLFPDGNYRHGSYVRQIKVVDKSNIMVDPKRPSYQLESFVDNTHCYNLKSFGYNGKKLGYSFFFGGPGGLDCGI